MSVFAALLASISATLNFALSIYTYFELKKTKMKNGLLLIAMSVFAFVISYVQTKKIVQEIQKKKVAIK